MKNKTAEEIKPLRDSGLPFSEEVSRNIEHLVAQRVECELPVNDKLVTEDTWADSVQRIREQLTEGFGSIYEDEIMKRRNRRDKRRNKKAVEYLKKDNSWEWCMQEDVSEKLQSTNVSKQWLYNMRRTKGKESKINGARVYSLALAANDILETGFETELSPFEVAKPVGRQAEVSRKMMEQLWSVQGMRDKLIESIPAMQMTLDKNINPLFGEDTAFHLSAEDFNLDLLKMRRRKLRVLFCRK